MSNLTSVDGKRFTFWKRFNIAGINGVYLRRLRMIQTPRWSIYLHHIDQPDPDLDPHDHPWPFRSIILRGGYTEHVFFNPENIYDNDFLTHKRFSTHLMPTRWAHKITEIKPGTITLIITGRRERVWGFWTKNPDTAEKQTKFVPWQDYVEMRGDTAVRKKDRP